MAGFVSRSVFRGSGLSLEVVLARDDNADGLIEAADNPVWTAALLLSVAAPTGTIPFPSLPQCWSERR